MVCPPWIWEYSGPPWSQLWQGIAGGQVVNDSPLQSVCWVHGRMIPIYFNMFTSREALKTQIGSCLSLRSSVGPPPRAMHCWLLFLNSQFLWCWLPRILGEQRAWLSTRLLQPTTGAWSFTNKSQRRLWLIQLTKLSAAPSCIQPKHASSRRVGLILSLDKVPLSLCHLLHSLLSPQHHGPGESNREQRPKTQSQPWGSWAG